MGSAVSTTSHQLLFQEVTWPRYNAPYAWFPTVPPSPKYSPVLTTNSTLCTPSVPSFTGTSVKVWKKVSSPKPVKILPPWKRTTKKLVPKPPKVKVKKKTTEKNIKFVLRSPPPHGLRQS